MNHYAFDDRLIRWQSLEGIPYLSFFILDIDSEKLIVDVLFKFSARQQIVLHRHLVQNNMLVLQGEHRLYTADGVLDQRRPTGLYTVSPPSPVPHREGGGDCDAIVYFSIRGHDRVFYEILDDNLVVMATLGMENFVTLYAEQQSRATPIQTDAFAAMP